MINKEDFRVREMLARVVERELAALALIRIRRELGADAVAALALHAIGFSQRSIAEILNVSRSEIWVLLQRAREVAKDPEDQEMSNG